LELFKLRWEKLHDARWWAKFLLLRQKEVARRCDRENKLVIPGREQSFLKHRLLSMKSESLN
jgi:hypothetical protein